MAFPPPPPVLHPLVVHLTIGLVPTAAAFAAVWAWRRVAWTRQAAYAVLTAAALLALVTMATGFRDYFAVLPDVEGTPTRDVLEWHERLGVVTTVFVVVTTVIAWWQRARVAARSGWAWALAVALGVATLLVALTGWFGGSLVYDHGVSVASAP